MTTSEQRESDAGEAAAKYAKLYHDCRAQLAAAERERDVAYDARRNADIYARRYEEQAESAKQERDAARAQLAAAERERDALQKFAALQDAWELEAMGDITALVKERKELRTRAERAEARHDAGRKVIEAAVATFQDTTTPAYDLERALESAVAELSALSTGHQGGA